MVLDTCNKCFAALFSFFILLKVCHWNNLCIFVFAYVNINVIKLISVL